MAVFDNGMSPVSDSANIDEARVPRSSFNMSRVTSFNGLFGALIPFDVMDTLPNEDYNIGYDVLALTRNPLMRRLQNGCTIYIHTWWMPKRDLWKGWDNFIDKGRSGRHVSSIPKYYPAVKAKGKNWVLGTDEIDHESTDLATITPFSPLAYMGVPIACYDNEMENVNYAYTPTENTNENGNSTVVNHWYGENTTNNEKWGITALDLVMYNKIYRDRYSNQNILMNNKEWFPDNEDDALILPYELAEENNGYCNTSMGTIEFEDVATFKDGESGIYIPDGTEETKEIKPYLNALHFRQFKGDYFTTANPFKDLIRGDNVDLDLTFDAETTLAESAKLISTVDAFPQTEGTGGSWLRTGTPHADLYIREGIGQTPDGTLGPVRDTVVLNAICDISCVIVFLIKLVTVETVSTLKGLTLNALRKALVLEKFMQRNATTNGTYKELIGAQFGYTPNVADRSPRYVGGCYQQVNFSEVVQTGATDGNDMLGKTASRGMSANSGYIGKFHSDDYGILMSIMSIVPDVYYDQQGIETRFTRTEQEQQYFPIFNNLEPQAILNKEIYVSGDKDYDEDVYGYANRFEDMKSRRNIICGLGACGEKAVYDSQNFMRRTFSNNAKPALTQKFLTMSPANIDLKPFASVNEPPFDIIVGCNIDKVSPMPYKAEPADMGIMY